MQNLSRRNLLQSSSAAALGSALAMAGCATLEQNFPEIQMWAGKLTDALDSAAMAIYGSLGPDAQATLTKVKAALDAANKTIQTLIIGGDWRATATSAVKALLDLVPVILGMVKMAIPGWAGEAITIAQTILQAFLAGKPSDVPPAKQEAALKSLHLMGLRARLSRGEQS